MSVERGHVKEARRRILNNRAPSNAGRRFWELSGGVLLCPCGRRMASYTAKRANGKRTYYYYVCGLRRSNHGRCEYGARYHRAEETEGRVRALVLGFLSRPDEVRRRAEEYVDSEKVRHSRSLRDLSGWKGRLADTERRRSVLIDFAADGTITREELRAKLSELDREREAARAEIQALGEGPKLEELERLEGLPEFAESLARDLPHLLDTRRAVRDYETVPDERTEENPMGMYTLTPDHIRHLPEEAVAQQERQAEDEKAARYRGMYEDLGLKVIAYPHSLAIATRWPESAGSERSRISGASLTASRPASPNASPDPPPALTNPAYATASRRGPSAALDAELDGAH